MTFMLDLFNDYSWEVDEVDKEITYDSLKELIAEPIFKALFEKYTSLSEKVKEDGSPFYRYYFKIIDTCNNFIYLKFFKYNFFYVKFLCRYNEEKVCKILAKVLLIALPVNKYNDFMESWKIGTPESK